MSKTKQIKMAAENVRNERPGMQSSPQNPSPLRHTPFDHVEFLIFTHSLSSRRSKEGRKSKINGLDESRLQNERWLFLRERHHKNNQKVTC